MEAATGAPAAAEGQPTEGQVEGQEETQENGAELAEWQRTVDQQLSSAADGVRQLTDLVQTRLPEPQQEEAPDFEQQFQELFDQNGGYVDPGQFQQLARQQAESIAREMIAPLQQQLGQFQQQMTAQEFEGLRGEFPELNEPKAVQALADKAADFVLDLGLPDPIAEALMQNSKFVRQVLLAGKASSRAQQETPAGQGQTPPQIETGGGSAPASSPEGDEWDRIANHGRETRGPIW